MPRDACGDASDPGELILGRTLVQFAPELAALTDMEAMLLSLVHPLVQVYTVPRTGELAYVGHVCNFRQDVKTLVRSLPLDPRQVPFILVRPRVSSSNPDQRRRLQFKVSVERSTMLISDLLSTISCIMMLPGMLLSLRGGTWKNLILCAVSRMLRRI